MTTSSPGPSASVASHNGPSPWLIQARAFVREITAVITKDGGARAALRSGVGKDLDDVPRMHRIVAARLPAAVLNDEDGQRPYYTVAALIAAYHRPGATGSAIELVDQQDDVSDDAQPEQKPSGAAAATHTDSPVQPAEDAKPRQEALSSSEGEEQGRNRYGESLGSTYARAVAAGARNGIRESAAETRLNLLSKQSTSGVHRHLPATARQLCDRGTPPDWARLLVDLRNWPQQHRRIARRWLQDYHRARNAAALDAACRADDAPQESPDTSDEIPSA
ncbi:type I-E CRISPR-associated protein Cse2/CasB [Streptomyces sp. NPDC059008]|uniref:type I-E CRISPR-associated protein Cse2/CasB n=1 Tax=Streptomyces sp. NPDC059008 TaxID=3346693 RepID=UPI0036B8384C